MLYGNLIFIKKTGGDGSKFPVTEKDIKIGRSEDCLIRIYNPQVAPEHCQLIIEDSGKATLRNLSNQTVLNGKPLVQGDTTLSHGDVFKIGARSARWEYLPSSVNYKQDLTPKGPTGRLVAVVMPQQRSSGDQATPGTSASQVSILKNTPLGMRMYKERHSEGSSAVKVRKSNGSELINKNKGDLLKFLTGRHSLKSTKLLLQGAKIKERKSTSGMASTKTPIAKSKGKTRKSTLPSWKVNNVSPPDASMKNRKSLIKSVKKSPKSAVKTPVKDLESKFDKVLLSTSKSEIKTPQRTPAESKSEEVVKSTSRNVLKSSLQTIIESPSKKSETLVKSTRSLTRTPSPKKLSIKSPSKAVFSTPRQKHPKLLRPVHSESKIKLSTVSTGKRRTRLTLDASESSNSVKILQETNSNALPTGESVADNVLQSPVKRTPRKSEITSVKKTPGKAVKSTKKSPQKKTPRKSAKTPGSVTQRKRKSTENAQVLASDSDDAPSAKRGRYTPRKSVSVIKTPANLVKSIEKLPSSASRKISVTPSIPSRIDKSDEKSTPQRGTPGRKSTKASASPRGVRRKLSPSSKAEIAAKKLKTSSPKKPDKNKKKALLVLGIASRKQLLSQNVKVLLKRKIVKKAIKQSTVQDPAKKKTAAKIPRKKPAKKPARAKKSPVKSPPKEKTPTATPRGRKAPETSPANTDQQTLPVTTTEKSPAKPKKKLEISGLSLLSQSYASETPPQQSPKNYLPATSCRSSKRLSSKNETDRPDFVELCPTALGLMPKNVEVFKTPKLSRRRSFNLSTPKNVQSAGIIKSASTSKIGNRKSVRFSSKDLSFSSETHSPNVEENAQYSLTPFQTPNVTLDLFVSPLTDKTSTAKKISIESALKTGENSKSRRSSLEPAKCVRKLLQSPQSSDEASSNQKVLPRSSRITASQSPSPAKAVRKSKSNLSNVDGLQQLFATPKVQNSPKNSLSDLKGVSRLLKTPREVKSPKNDLTDVKGVKKLFETPKVQNSPKNDLTDVSGVKRLLKTPKVPKSPKNDLSDVRGVKKLLRTPKAQRSPKNDLSDVRGVKKLLKTPRAQKSPKNDLSDVRGVKKMLRTPKAQRSPKNDLSDLRGVKKLLQSPKVQKSPKNDLSDVRGVKKLLKTPKAQRSPKNDLSDLRGVKKLLQSPKVQKSPKNDLSDLRGVKKLLQSPKVQKSPKNDLSDLRGVKKLLQSPRVQKSPKNDLSDLRGVKKLLQSPKVQRSPKNELTDLRGVKTLLGSPKVQKGPKNDLSDLTGLKELFTRQKSPRNNLLDVSGVGKLFESPALQKLTRNPAGSPAKEETLNEGLTNVTAVHQLLISKSPENKKGVSRKSHVKDYRAIRGRRMIHSLPKAPKNDLSDPTGVRELFLRHKPAYDFDIDLTGVAELFELPKIEAPSTPRPTKSKREAVSEAKQKRSKAVSSKKDGGNETEMKTRGTRSRKALTEPAGSKEPEEAETKGKRATKRTAAEEVKTTTKKAQKSAETETKSRPRAKSKTTAAGPEEAKRTRKRAAPIDSPEPEPLDGSPPKLRRRGATVEATKSSASKSGSSGRAKSVANSEKETAVKSAKKTPAKAKTAKVQSKTAIKTGTKQVQKVQNRSQTSSKTKASPSEEKFSPRKTRSAKVKPAGKKTVERASPVVKRSTRRK